MYIRSTSLRVTNQSAKCVSSCLTPIQCRCHTGHSKTKHHRIREKDYKNHIWHVIHVSPGFINPRWLKTMMATTTSISMALPIGMAQWLRKNSGRNRLISNHEQVPPAHQLLGPVGNPTHGYFGRLLSAVPNHLGSEHEPCLHSSPDKSWWFTNTNHTNGHFGILTPILTIIPVTLHASVLITHREYEPLIILTEYYIQLNRPNIARCLMAHPPLHDDPKTISTLICIQEGPIVYV